MPTVHLLFPERNDVAREAALAGIRHAFEGAAVETATGVDEVLLKVGHGSEPVLLVMIQPEMAELELALKTGQEEGLARWPVVSLSDSVQSSGLAVIPPEDWHGPLLARVFHSALQTHELTLENARLRGDLLTIARRVSHDLRTPLSAIFTTAELLKEILADYSQEDAALVTPLFDSTQAVLKLIDRVSQVAKATAEVKPKERVDMGQVVWTARQNAEPAAMRLGVQMVEADVWPDVQGVPAWLEIIWANLLSNAVNFGGKGSVVKMQWRELPEEFEFSVSDHGAGVTPEKQARLFQPFEKLHQSHSTKGLGLPIVRRLVELQGGRCGYEPGEGGGSRFYFTLPKTPLVAISAP